MTKPHRHPYEKDNCKREPCDLDGAKRKPYQKASKTATTAVDRAREALRACTPAERATLGAEFNVGLGPELRRCVSAVPSGESAPSRGPNTTKAR